MKKKSNKNVKNRFTFLHKCIWVTIKNYFGEMCQKLMTEPSKQIYHFFVLLLIISRYQKTQIL